MARPYDELLAEKKTGDTFPDSSTTSAPQTRIRIEMPAAAAAELLRKYSEDPEAIRARFAESGISIVDLQAIVAINPALIETPTGLCAMKVDRAAASIGLQKCGETFRVVIIDAAQAKGFGGNSASNSFSAKLSREKATELYAQLGALLATEKSNVSPIGLDVSYDRPDLDSLTVLNPRS